jgi:hypothetical protein
LITTFGAWSGLAPKAVGDATKFSIDLLNNTAHERAAMDWYRGFTSGKAKPREVK